MITHVFHSAIVSGPETLALPALKRLGEPVSIVFLDEKRLPGGASGPVSYARGLGHEVRTVPVRSRWDKRAFSDLRDTLEDLGARVVHAHDVKASLYVLQAARLRGRGRLAAWLVSTHHGAAVRTGINRLYEEVYVRWGLPRYDAVLSVCRGDYSSLSRRGVPARSLRVHLNGVDRLHVPPSDRERLQQVIRARWRALDPTLPPAGSGTVYLGAVARLSGEKRHDRMLRALATVKRLRPELRFVLLNFGIGPGEGELRGLTRSLGLEDEVRWMGYSKTIGQEMAGFDLLLCLSDGEGIPINLIEAGWSGTPVLSTEVGGIPDLIHSPEVGYLVKKSESDGAIGAKLAEVIADPMGRARRGARFQKRVATRFSERAWLEQLREVYATLPAARAD